MMLHQPSGQLADANYDQLDLAASLRAQSLQQEARIKIEERKAQLYETTMYRRSCCTRARTLLFRQLSHALPVAPFPAFMQFRARVREALFCCKARHAAAHGCLARAAGLAAQGGHQHR